MASVKKGMSGLRDYVQSQSTDKDHLYEWEKYQDYETLGKAIKGLEAATEKFKKLAKEAEGMQMPRRLMTTLVQNAIMTSISVSDMAHYILRTMNSKTRHCFEEVDKSKFLDSTKTEMKDLIIQDATALLCSTTDTTRATYTSLDLLLKILHDATEFDTLEPLDLGFPKSKKAAPTGSLRKIVTGVLIALPLLSAFCFNPWLPPTELYQRLTEQTHVQNLHLQTQINQLRDEVIKTVRAEPHMQAEELTELYGRMDALGDNIKTMEKQFQDVGLRIDNLWEALGPPNEHGTYFDPSPNGHYNKEPALPSSNDDQGHLQMSRQQFKALDAEIVKLRREMHRVDIRLTREVKNIQRKI